MITAWWNQRLPRERMILLIGATVTGALLVWALVWHPLANKRIELGEQIVSQRESLAYVRAATAEMATSQSGVHNTRRDRQGKSLLALVDASARAGGLEAALKRVEPVGTRSVRASFEYASFDDLMQWLESLARDYGVRVSDFSADRSDGVGLVSARVTLEDPG
ncbi:MAG: type II secretion system protein M [Dokdonella sp.]